MSINTSALFKKFAGSNDSGAAAYMSTRPRGEVEAAAPADDAPTSNTGRLETAAGSVVQTVQLVMVGGKIKEVAVKTGAGTAAHIDALTVTLSEDVFIRNDLGSDDEIAGHVSADIFDIFGFGISKQANGRNGYRVSYLFGTDKVSYGYLAFGGSQQRGSLCMHFTGTGLLAARDGWEQRLYDFLQDHAPEAKITRCDLAHDFFNGEYTPDQALSDWEAGLFTSRYTKPVAECVGTDWLANNGMGKTFYIGSRKSSKYCRVYEKGKQLGDKDSAWVRFELELKCKDIIIPHDILLNPGQYLTGAYPVCEELFNNYNEQIAKPELKKKLADVSQEHVIKYACLQAAPSIKMMRKYGFDDSEILEMLENEQCNYPKRLNPAAFDVNELKVMWIHEYKRVPRSYAEFANSFGDEFREKTHQHHNSYDEYRSKRFDRECEELNQFIDSYLTPDVILNPAKHVRFLDD